MVKKKFFSAKNVAMLGVLLALVIVMQAFGGAIPIGIVSLNFTLIPIVLGAILLGAWAGAFLGFACGLVVLYQVIVAPAGSGFYYIIWSNDPLITILTCLVKTTLAGWVAGYLFQWLEKKNGRVAIFIASGIVPIINTAVFILCCFLMKNSIVATQEWFVANVDAKFLGMNPFVFVLVGLVTFNFFAEFAVNLLVAPGLHTVYKVAEKRMGKKRK
ncbi:MAG: ECF transporter S component [Clostridiales bacterium]|nr:ECF transporter S component [Clostridiales bacterium]